MSAYITSAELVRRERAFTDAQQAEPSEQEHRDLPRIALIDDEEVTIGREVQAEHEQEKLRAEDALLAAQANNRPHAQKQPDGLIDEDAAISPDETCGAMQELRAQERPSPKLILSVDIDPKRIDHAVVRHQHGQRAVRVEILHVGAIRAEDVQRTREEKEPDQREQNDSLAARPHQSLLHLLEHLTRSVNAQLR